MIKKFMLPLKIQKSERVIKEALNRFSQSQTALAWTGGKDSTVLLWMVRRVCTATNMPIPKLVFINEGDLFPEVEEFVDKISGKWGLTVQTIQNADVLKQAKTLGSTIQVAKLSARNRKELHRLGFRDATFPFEPESFVGNHLMKTVPMNMYIEKNNIQALITGIRKDEQEARSKETYFSPRTNPSHFRVHPILHFTEQDVWETIHAHSIPYVRLYEQGYRSLGVKSTTTKVTNVPAWKQDLRHTKEREGRRQDKEKIMTKLRSLGYM